MNGKKARALRKLAGHSAHSIRHYYFVEHTRRRRQTKDLLGKVTSEIVTGTLQLQADKSGERVAYKLFKRAYTNGRMRL